MMKIFISDAVVSKGYDGAPAIRFFSSEGGGEFAVFQIGKRKYDSRAENNHRWVNLKVKAFGDVCERIKKMKLKEGSFISLTGDYDEERWTDKNTNETRTAPVISLDDIKFSYAGGGQKKDQTGGGQDGAGQGQQGGGYPAPQSYPGAMPQQAQAFPGAAPQAPAGTMHPQGQPTQAGAMPQNFTGYENFGGGNPYFPG